MKTDLEAIQLSGFAAETILKNNRKLKTVSVTFDFVSEKPERVFTYLTILEIPPGKEVIVQGVNPNEYKVGLVVESHKTPKINNKATWLYKWVISTGSKSINVGLQEIKDFLTN